MATKSPREFPIAKIVNPRIASDNPKICPKVYLENLVSKENKHEIKQSERTCNTPTTSFTIVKIQTIATKNPTKQSTKRAGCFGSANNTKNAVVAKTDPITKATNGYHHSKS